MSDRNEFKWLNDRVTEQPTDTHTKKTKNSHIVHTELWGFIAPGDLSGFWIGKAAPGLVGGWARGASHVDTRQSEFIQFDASETSLERCLLMLPLTGISALRTEFDLSDKSVAVVGTGALSVLTRRALDTWGIKCSAGWSHAEHSDLIIDTGVALTELSANGSRARSGATYVKFAEPDSAAVDIDFYPNVHKRSLRFFCLPLFVPEPAMTFLPSDALDGSIAEVFAEAPSSDGSKWIIHRRML